MSEIDDELFKMATEITADIDTGEIGAILCVLVKRTGGVRTLVRYTPGCKFPLLGGATIALHNLVDNIELQP